MDYLYNILKRIHFEISDIGLTGVPFFLFIMLLLFLAYEIQQQKQSWNQSVVTECFINTKEYSQIPYKTGMYQAYYAMQFLPTLANNYKMKNMVIEEYEFAVKHKHWHYMRGISKLLTWLDLVQIGK